MNKTDLFYLENSLHFLLSMFGGFSRSERFAETIMEKAEKL